MFEYWRLFFFNLVKTQYKSKLAIMTQISNEEWIIVCLVSGQALVFLYYTNFKYQNSVFPSLKIEIRSCGRSF